MTDFLPTVSVMPGQIDLRQLFPEAQRFALEVGFGGGEHLAEQARRNPDTGYIGCEPFENGVAKLLTQVQASRLRNVRVVPDDARDILVGCRMPRSLSCSCCSRIRGRSFAITSDASSRRVRSTRSIGC